jgi:hypothetical protein
MADLLNRISQLETIVKTQERKLRLYHKGVVSFQTQRPPSPPPSPPPSSVNKEIAFDTTTMTVTSAPVAESTLDRKETWASRVVKLDATTKEGDFSILSNWADDEDFYNDQKEIDNGDEDVFREEASEIGIDSAEKSKLFEVLSESKFETRTVIYLQNIVKKGLNKHSFCTTVLSVKEETPSMVIFKPAQNERYADKYYAFVFCKSHEHAVSLLKHILLTPLIYEGHVLQCNWANEKPRFPTATDDGQ